MKNTWSVEFLERRHGVRGSKEWMKEQAAKFEERFHVPFTYHHAHGKIAFLPYLDSTIPPVDAPSMEAIILERLSFPGFRGVRSFWNLQRDTGWHFDDLLAVCQQMVKTGRAGIDVNRMGKAVCLVKRD